MKTEIQTKNKISTSITLDGFKLEISGFYDEKDWETTMSFPDIQGIYLPSRTWVDDDTYIYDEDDLSKYAWAELFRVIEKYNGFSVSEEKVEVEVEVEEFDDED